MTQSNVEIVRAGYRALAEGGVEAILPFIHPEFEATTPPGLAAEPDTYLGHEGVHRWFDSFYEVMEEIRFEPEEYIPVGELVVVPFTLRARGGRTGIDTSQSAVQVWSLRDGKVIGLELFATLDEAMAAATGSRVDESS